MIGRSGLPLLLTDVEPSLQLVQNVSMSGPKSTVEASPTADFASYFGGYDTHAYTGLAGWVMRNGHALLETPFMEETRFDRVVEVGAGSGEHFAHVQHQFGEYIMTDSSEVMLKRASDRWRATRPSGVLKFETQDASNLQLKSESVDRVIAAHVLEHIPKPHEVVETWWRVLRPGGVLSLVLPCDPGVMWRLGRALGPRQSAKRAGLDYDYLMALEHINSIMGLRSILHHKFGSQRFAELWWPLPVASVDLNLIYCLNVWK